MRTALLMAAAIAALALPARGSRPKTPEEWRSAAAADVTAIHDILRDNSPAMVVRRDSGPFRRWLDVGLHHARADLPKVADGRGYYYLIERYVAGFRDSHIQFRPIVDIGMSGSTSNWPGFVVGAQGDGYEVVFRPSDASDAPPLRARLVGCDGQSAEALVDAHDRYDGDLSLVSNRYIAAFGLMFDHGDPFVARPKVCTFEANGERRHYPLRWRLLDQAHQEQMSAALSQPDSKPLGLTPWGERRWWITVPSMQSGQDWNGFYAAVKARLDALRSTDVVVIDVRGNRGGDSDYGDRFARLFWGDALVDARKPSLGPTVWRATKLNRDAWATLVDKMSKDANEPAAVKAEIQAILSRYDQALARGDGTFEIGDNAPPKRPLSGLDPVRGRVVVLTDYACVSACLDLMDEVTAMPNVVQAGTVTSADTIFMELTQVPKLPSGLASFAFGHKAWIRRPRGSNIPYTPSPRLTWTGALNDDEGLYTWLENALAAR
jgi:Peptidase family S41